MVKSVNTKINLGKSIDFADAQKLYGSYSPLKTNFEIKQDLIDILGDSIQRNVNEVTARKICNDIVFKYYPNEISIKAAFTNQVLLKTRNHISVFELSVGGSRADICKINGTSIAYEIKTDLDNLSRLEKQLEDYLQVFEKVYVICSSSKVEKIAEFIPKTCGIYTYRLSKQGNYRFEIIKEATDSEILSSIKQLSILTKKEILTKFEIDSSLSKEVQIINIISKYDKSYVNEKFKTCMKEKYSKKWNFLKDNYKDILEIDYQWFFKYTIDPKIIYQ